MVMSVLVPANGIPPSVTAASVMCQPWVMMGMNTRMVI